MADNNDNLPMDGASAQAPTEGQSQVDGIQQRINELTAQLHKKDETIDKLTGLVQQQLAAQVAPARQEQVDEYANLIPQDASDDQKAMFKNMFGTFAKLVDAKLQTVQRQVAVTTVAGEVQQLAQQYNINEEVAQKAQQYLAMWRQDGREFNAHDAVRFAIGDVALTRRPDPRGVQQPMVFRASNPIPQTQQQATQPLPSNFEDLSIDQQWELLAKRVGDKPL